MIYWRGWFRLDWNSEHVAKRFGVYHDNSEHGRAPDYYSYKGWLGNHMWV